MINPLANFLVSVERIVDTAIDASYQPSDLEGFTRKKEEMAFAIDIVDRIRMLSRSLDQSSELTQKLVEIGEQLKARHAVEGPTINLSTDEVKAEEDPWLDADILVSFIYYELKSLTDMLRQWNIRIDVCPELFYLLKVRDRFLTHPQLLKVSRGAYRGGSMAYGGLTLKDAVGLNSWDSITRPHYLQRLGIPLSQTIDDAVERARNRQLVLSPKRNEEFTDAEITRLKAFGVPEPAVVTAILELTHLLSREALPKIKQCFDEAVERFGFERY